MVAHPTLTKPQQRQKRILSLVCLSVTCFTILVVICVFTSLGDGLAFQGFLMIKNSKAGVKSLAPLPPFPPCDQTLSNHMPCFDPQIAVQFSQENNEFRERHCPDPSAKLRCLVPPPPGYRTPISWPNSIEKVWFHNVPHTAIADDRKKNENWLKRSGDTWVFPGGGSMFRDGVDKYLTHLANFVNFDDKLRTALDIGAGVGSFGAALLNRRVLTLSIAPKDSYRGQVQFTLERGIPAMIGILATKRMPFPSLSFDLVHCSRCSVSWAGANGTHLFEVDRLLRPGGYFALGGQPVQWKGKEAEWARLQELADALCWETVKVVGNVAVWRKREEEAQCPTETENKSTALAPACHLGDDPDNAWYVRLQQCAVRTRPSQWTREPWPGRLTKPSPRVHLVAPEKSSLHQWITGGGASSSARADGGQKQEGNIAGRVELASEGTVKSVVEEQGEEGKGEKGKEEGVESGNGAGRRRLLGGEGVRESSAEREVLAAEGGGVLKKRRLGTTPETDEVTEEVTIEMGSEGGAQGGAAPLSSKQQGALLELDTKRWRNRVLFYKRSFLRDGLQEGRYRNVLDMNAGLGGFAVGMLHHPVWVMNVVPSTAPNTLPAIFDRGLIGTQHDWCESFSSYPRSYDLVHLQDMSALQPHRCGVVDILLEVDRLLRPGGTVIVRDVPGVIAQVEQAATAMYWSTKVTETEKKNDQHRLLVATKRPWLLEEGKLKLLESQG